jgi:hypothetical protein
MPHSPRQGRLGAPLRVRLSRFPSSLLHVSTLRASILRAAEVAGLRLVGLEKRPDGTVKFEFGDLEEQSNENWFAGGPLYKSATS